MKRIFPILLTVVLVLTLLCGCGKSRSDKLMDRYSELANAYSSYSATVAAMNDVATLGKFSTIGIELTDLATELAKKGDEMTEDELDAIEKKLNEIEEKFNAIKETTAPAEETEKAE